MNKIAFGVVIWAAATADDANKPALSAAQRQPGDRRACPLSRRCRHAKPICRTTSVEAGTNRQGVAATADPQRDWKTRSPRSCPRRYHRSTKSHFHFSRFGKLLCGRTALAVAAAVGLDDARALHWALAVELMPTRPWSMTIFATGMSNGVTALRFFRLLARRWRFVLATGWSPGVRGGDRRHRRWAGGAAFAALAAAMRRLSEGQVAEFTGAPCRPGNL